MQDSIQTLSKPIKIKKTKLGILFKMKPRKNPKKLGRELLVVDNDRAPLVKGFKTRYSYVVRFLKKENVAGNHYHNIKEELFISLVGKFKVELEDIKTKERESLTLEAGDNTIFYVRTGIAHKVISSQKGDLLLVMASEPSREEDEHYYEVNM